MFKIQSESMNCSPMTKYILIALLVIFTLLGCSQPTPTQSAEAKIIIESVIDKQTGEPIDNATLVIHVERDGKEGIVYEDFDFSEYVIEGKVGDYVSIEVNAPGYEKWKLAMRFKKAGVLKFPVEMEREVEGIDV